MWDFFQMFFLWKNECMEKMYMIFSVWFFCESESMEKVFHEIMIHEKGIFMKKCSWQNDSWQKFSWKNNSWKSVNEQMFMKMFMKKCGSPFILPAPLYPSDHGDEQDHVGPVHLRPLGHAPGHHVEGERLDLLQPLQHGRHDKNGLDWWNYRSWKYTARTVHQPNGL